MWERLRIRLEGMLEAIPNLVLILLVALVALWLIGRFATRVTSPKEFSRRSVRSETLRVVLVSSLRVLIWVLTLTAMLSALGVNVTALLAGVSVLGLAVSFGAQSLVRDVLNGFFILLEDQYGVGDIVKVNAAAAHVLSGSVETLNLRVTVLRDLEGTAHIIPNGEIKSVSVLSKDWARVVSDIEVPNHIHSDTALSELQKLLLEFAADPAHAHKFLEPPEVLGVQALGTHMTIRVLMKVLPKEQWVLARAWRKAVKDHTDTLSWQTPAPNIQLTLPAQAQLVLDSETKN
jgi:moderate conductance mechanosensitive channel